MARPGLLLAAWLTVLAAAARSAPSDQLQQLRARIEALQRQLTESEGTQAEAADSLRESERAISNANRRLFELAQQQRAVKAVLNQLDQTRSRTLEQVQAQQTVLAKLLYQGYVSGPAEPLRIVLSQQDPNQIARQMHYLSYIYRERAELVASLRANAVELQQLSDQAEARSAELARLQGEQGEQKKRLEQQRHQHASLLKQVSSQIAHQRSEMGQLRRNEERLARLVERLARELAHSATRERRVRNDQLPQPTGSDLRFSGLKGRLRLPVIGELAERFGSPRGDSGLSSKGLFIAARQGQEVRAVAAGRVVFADWIRGFGNLMILDHGEGYMSLYANNEALLRQVGDRVKAADPIAAVGATGGNPETGLYFELRFQGKPFDPLTWVTLR